MKIDFILISIDLLLKQALAAIMYGSRSIELEVYKIVHYKGNITVEQFTNNISIHCATDQSVLDQRDRKQFCRHVTVPRQ